MSNTLLDRIVRKTAFTDPIAGGIQKAVGGFYGVLGPVGRLLKDVAHGSRWLRHPLHPLLTDVPIGAMTAVIVLDITAHYTASVPHVAATVAMWVAVLGALGALLTGYTDFHETFGHEMRTAFLHGVTNTVAFALMVISLVMRTAGHDTAHTAVVSLDIVAYVLLGLGGYIGGHIVFAIGTMVNRTAFLEGGSTKKAIDVGADSDFAEGEMKRVDAKGLPVVVSRVDGRLCAIAAVCSHAGGPLDEGTLTSGKVTCPWHGSVFNACTGKVVHGPATADQPALDVEVTDGRVMVKLQQPLH